MTRTGLTTAPQLAARAALVRLAGATSGCAPAPTPVSPEVAAREPRTTVRLSPLEDGLWLHTTTRQLDGVGAFPSHGLLVEGGAAGPWPRHPVALLDALCR